MILKVLSPSPSLQSWPSVCHRIDIDFCRVQLCNQWHQPKLTDWLKIRSVARVHLCNRNLRRAGSAPVANGLKHPVSFGFFRISVPIGFPVAGMVGGPFLLAELLCGPIVRIGLDFDPLPGRFPGSPAFGPRAVILFFVSWDKRRCAMETRRRFHSSSPGQVSFLRAN